MDCMASMSPWDIFFKWLNLANEKGIPTDRMIIATASKNAIPSLRVVLLKDIKNKQIYWYGNSISKKGKNIASNPVAEVLFYWHELKKQIRISGNISLMSKKKTKEYFFQRTKKRQISALISKQSHKVKNGINLRDVFKNAIKEHKNKKIKMPKEWQGYKLTPHYFEFWSDDEDRLHDRACFEKKNNKKLWKHYKLYP